mmetsp:Transcript_1697/g.6806  ORF Transcript_1697/g.6806 Transcript_1697/m.6806 type:complete len:320 (-) Transcript_1697:1703-2662(-)
MMASNPTAPRRFTLPGVAKTSRPVSASQMPHRPLSEPASTYRPSGEQQSCRRDPAHERPGRERSSCSARGRTWKMRSPDRWVRTTKCSRPGRNCMSTMDRPAVTWCFTSMTGLYAMGLAVAAAESQITMVPSPSALNSRPPEGWNTRQFTWLLWGEARPARLGGAAWEGAKPPTLAPPGVAAGPTLVRAGVCRPGDISFVPPAESSASRMSSEAPARRAVDPAATPGGAPRNPRRTPRQRGGKTPPPKAHAGLPSSPSPSETPSAALLPGAAGGLLGVRGPGRADGDSSWASCQSLRMPSKLPVTTRSGLKGWNTAVYT